MHIPDGFLNPGTSGTLIVASVGFLGLAVNRVRKAFFEKARTATLVTPEGAEFGSTTVARLTSYGRNKMFRMAVVGAFIFATQMVNFPVAHGTSGHLLGGVLAAILLGPWAGMLVIAVVLAVQSLLFADGGLVALGANIFNMGIIGAVGGYYIYKFLLKRIKKVLPSAFIAAWLSVVIAASVCAVELSVSGTENLAQSFSAMAGIHALIGLGEGLITVMVLIGLKHKEKNNE